MKLFIDKDISTITTSEDVVVNTNHHPSTGDSAKLGKIYSEFSSMIEWSEITGTTNGTVEIIGIIDDKETVLDTVTINSVSNTTDPVKVDFSGTNSQVVNAVRYKINKVDMTGGNININHIQKN